MITRTTELVDARLVQQAAQTIADDSPISALDPADMTSPIVLADGLDIIDGCHRVLGIARWAEENGLDLDDAMIEIPALHVQQTVIDAEHPYGERTPGWLVAGWAARAKQ